MTVRTNKFYNYNKSRGDASLKRLGWEGYSTLTSLTVTKKLLKPAETICRRITNDAFLKSHSNKDLTKY